MLVRDVMTRRAATVEVEETLQAAARRMRELDVGALPVIEGGAVVGFVTDRDITVRAVAAGEDPRHASVRVAMTAQVVSCREDEDVQDAAQRMQEFAVRRLPVLDPQERLAGMLSVEDLADVSVALATEVLQHGRHPGLPVRH
jgi:CBS domain-containing protein